MTVGIEVEVLVSRLKISPGIAPRLKVRLTTVLGMQLRVVVDLTVLNTVEVAEM